MKNEIPWVEGVDWSIDWSSSKELQLQELETKYEQNKDLVEAAKSFFLATKR